MKHIKCTFVLSTGMMTLLSACSSSSFNGSLGSGDQGTNPQRYVHLSFPIQATPTQQAYILNSSQTQQIAYWTTVQNSLPGINPPYPYFVLPLNQNAATTFYLVVPTGSGSYTGCSLNFDQNGVMNGNPQDACPGWVSIPNQDYNHKSISSLVTVYNLGANFGSSMTINPGVLSNQVSSQSISRNITFKNNSNYDVCLVDQISGNPNPAPMPSQMCDEPYQTKVLSGTSVGVPVPVSGLNSAAWIVAGYRASGTQAWTQTGFAGSSRQQAATKFEFTMYPYYPSGTQSGPILNSVGPTNIDISSVDGANLIYKFYPQSPVAGATRVCTLADGNVSPATQYTGVYNSASPMSYFANADGSGKFSCSSGSAYQTGTGCASPCSMSYVNEESQTEIDQKCCIGSFGTPTSCAQNNPYYPANSNYTAMIHSQFINSYSFAYDDAKADFTCDPFASYVFEIDNVGYGLAG